MLLSYDKAARRISFRHYSIVAQPSGVSKSVKALVGRRALPDMSAMQDVSEFLTRSGYGSVRHWSYVRRFRTDLDLAVHGKLGVSTVSSGCLAEEKG